MSEPSGNWSMAQVSQSGLSAADGGQLTAYLAIPALRMGDLKAIIPRNEPHGLANPPEVNGNPEITQCAVIGSYNWTEAHNPTILVPGKPPRWSPFTIPGIMLDRGQHFRDEATAKAPAHPLEPAVRAVLAQDPEFDTSSVDVVSCRSSLGHLLEFLSGTSDKKFRIVIEIIGPTAFFFRREDPPLIGITAAMRARGQLVPQTMTHWEPDVHGSESHQRVVKYDFAGLSCVVRYGVDAYMAESQGVIVMDNAGLENMTAMFEATGLDTGIGNQHITVNDGGHDVPQSSVLEVVVRSILSKEIDLLAELIPGLWLSQIMNVAFAFHDYAIYHDIFVNNISERMKQWQTDNRMLLYVFSGLLRRLIDFAKQQPDGRIEIIHEAGADRLELRSVADDVHNMLPESLGERWISGPGSESSESSESSQSSQTSQSSQSSESSESSESSSGRDDNEDEDVEMDEEDEDDGHYNDYDDDSDSDGSYYRGGFGNYCMDRENEYDLDYLLSSG